MDGLNAFFWTLTYLLWAGIGVFVLGAIAGVVLAITGKRPTPPANTLTLKPSE